MYFDLVLMHFIVKLSECVSGSQPTYQLELVQVGVAKQASDDGLAEAARYVEVEASVVGRVVCIPRGNVPYDQHL